MPKKTGTIHIKWVRSGIGFSRKQREVVRSIGLGRLNQVVERPDTVHFRGMVAKVSHLVEVVGPSEAPAWAGVPEYKIIPAEVAPGKTSPAAKKTKAAKETPAEAPAATQEVATKGKETEKTVAPAKRPAAAKTRAAKSPDKKEAAGSGKPTAKQKPAAAKSAASEKKESKSKKGKK